MAACTRIPTPMGLMKGVKLTNWTGGQGTRSRAGSLHRGGGSLLNRKTDMAVGQR